MEMEFQIPEAKFSEDGRVKTSDRMHYEAQVEVIKKQIGDLGTVRQKLGLSQRKICQLLMVDPSAWTRWTKKGDQAPPHIYRSLQWYMTLREKIPGLTPQYFIGKDPEVLHRVALEKIEVETQARVQFQEQIERLQTEKQSLESQLQALEMRVQATRVGFFMLVLACLIMAGSLMWRFRS